MGSQEYEPSTPGGTRGGLHGSRHIRNTGGFTRLEAYPELGVSLPTCLWQDCSGGSLIYTARGISGTWSQLANLCVARLLWWFVNLHGSRHIRNLESACQLVCGKITPEVRLVSSFFCFELGQ